MASSSVRSLRVLLGLIILQAAVWLLFLAPEAMADTHISQVTYNSNTEWTVAGSPYILDGNVTVSSGVTLTIDPGVTVKFNGTFRTMTINGTLSSSGTSASPIKFTSIQDGGSGGAPGQWYGILFNSGSSGTFNYVTATYGGYGSSSTSYAEVKTQNSTATVTIDHSLFENSQTAGVGDGGGSVTVSHTEIKNNGAGAWVNNGVLTINSNSNIRDNTHDGVFVNNASWTGTASSFTHSSFENNGGNGIKLQVDTGTPDASTPFGNSNNIDGNTGKQVWVLRSMPNTDWTNNYLGSTVTYVLCSIIYEPPCVAPAGYVPYYLAGISSWDGHYWASPTTPPDGPVTHATYNWVAADNKVYSTGLDYVKDSPFSSTIIDNSGY